MNRTEWLIHSLVDRQKQGEIALPALQRGYVWKSTQVRDLLDSLYRNYPIGTFLIWEPPGRKDDIQTREVAVDLEASGNWTRLLLDGQQRLTSLVAVFEGKPIKVKDRKRAIEIMFNMNHPDYAEESAFDEEEPGDSVSTESPTGRSKNVRESLEQRTFIVKTKALENEPNWVSVTGALNTPNWKILKEKGIETTDPRYEKFMERLSDLQQISKRPCSIVLLEEKIPYKSVTDIFVRVNSLGTKLKSSELALAQVTVKWKGVVDAIDKYMKKIKEKYDIDINFVMRNFAAFATGYPNFNTLHEVGEKKLQASWKESIRGLDEAIDIVQGLNFEDPFLLSSSYFVNTTAAVAKAHNYKIVGSNKKKFRFWLYMGSMKGRYSGSTESALEQDMAARDDIDKLISNLRNQVGRFRLEVSDIEGMNKANPLFKILFIMLKEKGAQDWYKEVPINLNPASARNRLDVHHIFPKSLLRDMEHESKDINDVANLAFLSKESNQKIGSRSPKSYLPEIDKVLLSPHLIPMKSDLWKPENYNDFLAARRKLIVKAMNDFLKVEEFE